jgi:hypothetical protein
VSTLAAPQLPFAILVIASVCPIPGVSHFSEFTWFWRELVTELELTSVLARAVPVRGAECRLASGPERVLCWDGFEEEGRLVASLASSVCVVGIGLVDLDPTGVGMKKIPDELKRSI